jgi:hypothetical protein
LHAAIATERISRGKSVGLELAILIAIAAGNRFINGLVSTRSPAGPSLRPSADLEIRVFTDLADMAT